ncbi:uncharacterized protein LOC131027886 [Cryptomeria japonica]|uniref:uncharacterized protein LOC131027886 n=1 Tax=Cryptomeria japonica TaxID=3369 RepID=UPI0027DA0763|nr:uncharacterized protein LOC131027886 [Cryptomeria japonica]
MASSSSSQQKNKNHPFSGIDPTGIRNKVSESTRLFDVFINHRGPDVKDTLARQFYYSLKELGIRAFLDSEEKELGHSFPSTIANAIRSAAVHIAIFSKRYAQSPWCLAELVLMLESKAKIIPVFYQVEPWELRYIEKGTYAGAFITYEKKSRYQEKHKEWKEALQSISFIAGCEIKSLNGSQCQIIASEVQKEVQRTKSLYVAKYPVALDKLVQDFERRCLHKLVKDFEIQCGINEGRERKSQIVGIFGMGGIGKTTLTKEIFNLNRPQFARACFLFDVREASSKSNLPSLQMKLVKDLFNEDGLNFQSTEEASSYISNCIERSSSLNFLIVLDDIDRVEQLDALVIMHMLNKSVNTLVIVTTRDVGVLISAGIQFGYHLKGLTIDDARQLFCWHAFSQPNPASGYEDLVDAFLGVCGGLPLSLQVLGRHVHGRKENYWRTELEKVRMVLHREIQQKLKISFDALDNKEKQIFMDIACFFVDQSKSIALRVWEASGWNAESGLRKLQDKCLVEVLGDTVPLLRMHDHLRDLGREMANELTHPRRLWRPRDLKYLESMGFENILAQTTGRCFHSFFDKSLNFEIKFFLGESDDDIEPSTSLLLLHIWYPYAYCGLHPSNLWRQHQLNFGVQPRIPSWIPLENLQCIRISNGYLKYLWQDAEAPFQLKELEIHGSFVENFPDFLGILTVAEKKVIDAKNMLAIESPLLLRSRPMNPHALYLNEGGMCATIRNPLSFIEDLVISRQENIVIIVINGNHCPSLQSLELSFMKNLIEVQFTEVETLNCLKVTNCEDLKRLSLTSDLTKLEELNISACPELTELNLGLPSCLKRLTILCSALRSVPGLSSFCMLVELKISRCPNLHELSVRSLDCLEKVIIENCCHLQCVTGISQLSKLVEVSISLCWNLQLELRLVDLNCVNRITVDMSVKVNCFELNGCKRLEKVSGTYDLNKIRIFIICDCPELRELPVICGASCLEVISINGCGKLNCLELADCKILEKLSGNFVLVRLSISDCPMLEELPCFTRLTCLEDVQISSCRELKKITLPTTLNSFHLAACSELKSVSEISILKNLVKLIISECWQLELQLHLDSMNSLQTIKMDRCGKLKSFLLNKCQNLKTVSGNFDVARLSICDCPELEELECSTPLVYPDEYPYFDRLNCWESISIVSCRKLQKITIPWTLIGLTVRQCREWQILAGICCHSKLEFLNIFECPKLVELPSLMELSCLNWITIDSCEQLEKITMPRALIGLTVRRCRELQTVAAIDYSTKLQYLEIIECPNVEDLPGFARLSFLKNIAIDSCEKLQTITGIEELQESEAMQLLYLKNTAIQNCIPMLKVTYIEEIRILRCGNLQNITLPMTLKRLELNACGELKNISAISALTGLVELKISKCPQLDELGLADLSWLEKLAIANLKSVSGISNLTKLVELEICECLEADLCLSGLRCLERIEIVECGKMHTITLPTSLIKLSLEACRKLETMTSISSLTKLVELNIINCPDIQPLLDLSDLNCLKMTVIAECWNMHDITLPTTLNQLTLQRCRGLQTVAGLSNHAKLTEIDISDCEKLEDLTSLAGLCCLERINIDSCERIHNITLPPTIIQLTVQRCRELQMIAGIGDVTEFTELYISECPKLEELPVICGPSCLERIIIDGCQKLNRLQVTDCRILKGVRGKFDLAQLWMSDCPELEELPCFASLVRLEEVRIIRCGKLQKITMPTTLTSLYLDAGTKLISLPEICHLRNLVQLIISHCWQLELELNLEDMSSLQSIAIAGCGKLKCFLLNKCQNLKRVSGNFGVAHLSICDCPELEELHCFTPLNYPDGFPYMTQMSCWESISIVSCEKLQKITLPKTLITLTVRLCRELQIVEGIEFPTTLRYLSISGCPKLQELPRLSRLSCLKRVAIDTCEKLDNIAGIEELQALEAMQLLYCSDAAIQNCIQSLEVMPSAFIQVIGRAAGRAKSNSNPCLFSEPDLCADLFTGLGTHKNNVKQDNDTWSEGSVSAIIVCVVVEVHSSTPLHTINESLKQYAWKFDLREGEWIITTVITDQHKIRIYNFIQQFEDVLIEHGIIRLLNVVPVMKGEEWKTFHVVRTIVEKLYQSTKYSSL